MLSFLVIQLPLIINIVCLSFRVLSSADATRRAGTLATVNMIILYVTGDLSGYTDVLSILRRSCQQIYQSMAWIVASLLILHKLLPTSVVSNAVNQECFFHITLFRFLTFILNEHASLY